MQPVVDIMPGVECPVVIFAKDQPEYLPLPAHVTADGHVITRWRLSWRERFDILFGGHLWLTVLTFNKPLQPVKITTVCPIEGVSE